MKKQHHPYKKIERQRGLYFRIGLVISLFITFLAFEWEAKIPRYEFPADPVDSVDIDHVVNTWTRKEKPIPEPKIEKVEKKKIRDIINNELKIVPDETPLAVITIDSIDPNDLIDVEPVSEPFFDDDIPRTTAEIMPSFKGGMEALKEFLESNTRFPENARKEGKDGLVYIYFVVDKDGKIIDISTKYASSELFEKEAQRVTGMMPDWNPGKQGGIPVKVQMVLPFKFKLE